MPTVAEFLSIRRLCALYRMGDMYVACFFIR